MNSTTKVNVRARFPALGRMFGDKPLIYFDNAATTMKPVTVIEAEEKFYSHYNANVHRGIHRLSDEATRAFEDTREKIRELIHAESTQEIIFTSGTTASINLLASSFCKYAIRPGDEILSTVMEHHSNIVPWQIHAADRGGSVNFIPLTKSGELDLSALDQLFSRKTKLLTVAHTSNSLGTINPVSLLISKAHERGIPVMIDAAQAIQHSKVNVQELDCDFMVFSGHKMYGPTGTGILFGKKEWLEKLPPWQGGGEMISEVKLEGSTWNDLPYKFEAGTPNIAGFIGLGAAVDFIQEIGYDSIQRTEIELQNHLLGGLRSVRGMILIGEAQSRTAVASFMVEGLHPSDIGALLDGDCIAIRTGHHCAQPVMRHFGVTGTARVSLAFYNTIGEVDRFIESLDKAIRMLR